MQTKNRTTGLLLWVFLGCGWSYAATLRTFNLTEQFGVAWPEQPIEFRYDGGQPSANSTRMMGPNGVEVPYQWVSSCSDASAVNGCIVVRSSLPVGANYTWTLQTVAPSVSQQNAIQMKQSGANFEVTNGLTGFRLVAANPGLHNFAPIQGILLPNGVWTGAGATPNLLYAETKASTGCIACALQTPMYTVTSYTVKIIDAGPMKVVVKASYTFNRPRYAYGTQVINNAGDGHYTIILTLYAKSKSVLVDEDSDMQFSYFLPVYNAVTPNHSRYKGHDGLDGAGVPDIACGYEGSIPVTAASAGAPIVINSATALSNGQMVAISGVQGNSAANGSFYVKTTGYPAGQFALYADPALTQPARASGGYAGGGIVQAAYRGQTLVPTSDAFMDLTYNSDRPASYRCDANSFRKLMVDYPSANHAAGWYQEVYNSSGGPVIGMFTGRASQQLMSASGPSMPGLYTSNRHWVTGALDAGFQVDTLLRGPDGTNAPSVHRNWGIFASTQNDLLPANVHQPIADEQNSLTGINLSRLYTYTLSYPDPPGGWNWLYLSKAGANQLISLVRNGTSVCGSVNCYYTLMRGSEGSLWSASLLNMWQGNSAAAVQTALNNVTPLAQNVVRTLAQGDNHFDGPLGYYQLGLQTSPTTVVLNAILMDSNSTPAQKTTAKAALALFGSLFWDNDWFPIDNATGDSVGLANQIQQYLQYRTQSVTAVPSQPFLATKLTQALTYPSNDLNAYFSPTGAAAGSTHYQSAFFEPLMLNYQNLGSAGLLPLTDPRWTAYANWELSVQTPPEPRFGNIRKGYSNGDGNTEADVRTGMLATALSATNPTVAGNLMWAWQQSNSARFITADSQFVSTLAVIDPTVPAIQPQLASTNIPGYHASERHGFGTPNETAVWFIDGGFYSIGGHRHYDDGQVTVYANSAPLALDWNANVYNPETPGRFMHNSVVFDTELGHNWNSDNAGLSDVSTLMQNPSSTEFDGFANSTAATGTFTSQDGTVWTRKVRTMAFNPANPIVYVADSFAGPSAGQGKTLTWNLMATGAVSTPAGAVTPVTRFSAGCQTVAGQLPSNGAVYSLNAGMQQFTFTGVRWPKHPAGGIDWDLLTISPNPTQQFLIGNWGHGCHPSREMAEYQTATGTTFSESQHILRVHDTGSFSTVLLPYNKGARPARTITQESCGLQIALAGETTCFNDSAAGYSNGTENILTVYDSSAQSAFGVTISGGPQEVTIQGKSITWTIDGFETGIRTVTLPAGWSTSQPGVVAAGNTFTFSYLGGPQAPSATIVFTQN